MKKIFKVLFLTNNDACLSLADWIANTPDTEIIVFQDKLTYEIVKKISPDILISYNYSHIIKEDVLNFMNGNSINMHISFLPWNKGADPNFWSFVENTPKGVTIHQMVPGLDAGDIIYQQEMFFDTSKETFASTYNMLQNAIQDLFKKNWDNIRTSNYSLSPQNGKGSYHAHKQFVELREKNPFEWDDVINDYIIKLNNGK